MRSVALTTDRLINQEIKASIMIESNSTTPSVVNLKPSNVEFPSDEFMELHESMLALSEYSDFESDQPLLQVVVKSCCDNYLAFMNKANPHFKERKSL